MLGTRQQTVRFPTSPAESLVVNDLYFPLASAPAAFWSVVRLDGGDIRVTTQDGVTKCAREVVGFDYASKTGSLFFQANGGTSFFLSAGSNAAEPAVDSALGSQSVWGSEYAGVWHMGRSADGTLSVADSTGKNSATNHRATLGSGGKVGRSAAFATSAAYVDVGNAAALQLTGALTFMAWANPTNFASYRAIFGKLTTYYPGSYDWMLMTTTGKPRFLRGQGTSSGYGNVDGMSAPTEGQWNHLAVTMAGGSGSAVIHYLNGSANGSGNLTATIADGGTAATIGRRTYDGGEQFFGSLDELRILNVEKSATWIAQHVSMQGNPASFWAVGVAT